MAPGRATAGAIGPIWREAGMRATEMAKPEAGEDGVVEKPTWEDIDTHNQCVGVVMGLRNGDRDC